MSFGLDDIKKWALGRVKQSASGPVLHVGEAQYGLLNLVPWLVHPISFAGNPKQDGTLGDIGASKSRVAQWAGMPNRIVEDATCRFGGNLQWGTPGVADGNYSGHAINTAYTATPSNVESSPSSWLKFKDNSDGTQVYAMGRIRNVGSALAALSACMVSAGGT